jgi:adenine C2-methylase RlmN of 23S rRNA A2503 and tRNA A37
MIQEHFMQRVTNVVFMGMGEPMLNIPAVVAAHRSLNEDLGIGSRNITISTVRPLASPLLPPPSSLIPPACSQHLHVVLF